MVKGRLPRGVLAAGNGAVRHRFQCCSAAPALRVGALPIRAAPSCRCWLSCPGRGAAFFHAAPAEPGPYQGRCLVRSRLCGATVSDGSNRGPGPAARSKRHTRGLTAYPSLFTEASFEMDDSDQSPAMTLGLWSAGARLIIAQEENRWPRPAIPPGEILADELMS